MTELALGLLGSLILTEIHICLPALAKWIVRRRASKLPPDLRERMEEEWLGNVESSPSHVWKVSFAVGLLIGRGELLQAHCDKPSRIHGDVTVKLTGVSATGGVGNLTPSEPGGIQLTGHAPIVIRGVSSLDVPTQQNVKIDDVPFFGNTDDGSNTTLIARWRRASSSSAYDMWNTGGSFGSTGQVLPGLVVSQDPSAKKID
jgi:hypothetical protein